MKVEVVDQRLLNSSSSSPSSLQLSAKPVSGSGANDRTGTERGHEERSYTGNTLFECMCNCFLSFKDVTFILAVAIHSSST